MQCRAGGQYICICFAYLLQLPDMHQIFIIIWWYIVCAIYVAYVEVSNEIPCYFQHCQSYGKSHDISELANHLPHQKSSTVLSKQQLRINQLLHVNALLYRIFTRDTAIWVLLTVPRIKLSITLQEGFKFDIALKHTVCSWTVYPARYTTSAVPTKYYCYQER